MAGARDGRVGEGLRPDYTPAGVAGFDAETEWRALHDFVKQAEQMAQGAEVTDQLRQQALSKEHAAKDLAEWAWTIKSGRIVSAGCGNI